MVTGFLPRQALAHWLAAMAAEAELWLPVSEGRAEAALPVFRTWTEGCEPLLDKPAQAPPKEAVFPSTEVLFRFEVTKDQEAGAERTRLEETLPDTDPVVVFGCRPCGARGFAVFDPVYLEGPYRDPYYARRRERTAFISLACARPERTCFCHWTGSGPSDVRGSDILLTPVDGGFWLEALTEQGQALAATAELVDDDNKKAEAEAVQATAAASLEAEADLAHAPAALLTLFDDDAFWDLQSAHCISCGACTYLCPTCYCFNITDEAGGEGKEVGGERLRTWDSCMLPQFTREASGHNPRLAKAQRLKNRVGHKFSYYPQVHGGTVACCGCGRCVRHCPAGVDIRAIVLDAMAQSAATKSAKEEA